MDATRAEARALVKEGVLLITRGDAVLDPDTFTGICRLRLAGNPAAAAAAAAAAAVQGEVKIEGGADVVGGTTKKRAGSAAAAGTGGGGTVATKETEEPGMT
jgi:hypothetical protein